MGGDVIPSLEEALISPWEEVLIPSWEKALLYQLWDKEWIPFGRRCRGRCPRTTSRGRR